MYYRLSTKNIVLEYMNETLSLEYYGMLVTFNTGYDITNLNAIVTSLVEGVAIEYLDIGNLIISVDDIGTLYIGDEFFIEHIEMVNLVDLLDQSESIRLRAVLPKNTTT